MSHRFPLYYLPPGMPRPAHLVHLGGIQVAPTVGPQDASPADRGGTIYGGTWTPASLPLWRKSRAGWWMALGDAAPHHLARLYPIDGRLVPGNAPGHLWLVPRLLAFRDDYGLVGAVPQEFRDYEWKAPARLAPLMDRLRALLSWTPDGEAPPVPDADTTQLAVDLLAINYHLTLDELTLAGWLTDALVLAVLAAASGQADLADRLAGAPSDAGR